VFLPGLLVISSGWFLNMSRSSYLVDTTLNALLHQNLVTIGSFALLLAWDVHVEAHGQNLKAALPPRAKPGLRMPDIYKACLILYPETAMWEGKALHSKLLQATDAEDMRAS
jgi:hypothetical protein